MLSLSFHNVKLSYNIFIYNTELPLLKIETLKIGILGQIMPIEPSEASIQTYCQFEFSGHDQVSFASCSLCHVSEDKVFRPR